MLYIFTNSFYTCHPPSTRGPERTPFEGGVFTTRLTFPTDYPLSPPKMKFVCEMFHPNGEDLRPQMIYKLVKYVVFRIRLEKPAWCTYFVLNVLSLCRLNCSGILVVLKVFKTNFRNCFEVIR